MTIQPPRAQRIPSVRELHGHTDVDNYAWMRESDTPEFLTYLAAERAYYDAQTAGLAELTDELFREAVARAPEAAEDSVGWTLRAYRYWYRTPARAENRQLLRARPGQAEPTLLLDENALAAPTGYIDVPVAEPSPDDRLLAWLADTSGAEIYQLRFTEIETGRELPDVIDRTYPGGAWSSASAHFFYLVPDGLNRPHQVWRHAIGTPATADELVYTEIDERFELTLAASRSGELIVITTESRDTTEVRVISAGEPLRPPAVVEPRRRGIEYRVDHESDPAGGAGDLLIVTDASDVNGGTPEFTLMRAPVDAPGRANWTTVDCSAIGPARADTRLLRCDVLAGHLLLSLRRAGMPLLAITDPGGGAVREIQPALAAGAIAVQHAADYRAGSVVIAEESLIEPPRWSELDLATGQRTGTEAGRRTGLLTRRCTARSGSPRGPTMARVSPLPSLTGLIHRWTAAPRACYTGTAPTRRAWTRNSTAACRRCWTAAWCTRSRTSVAAASAAGTGGSRAGCGPSRRTFSDFIDVAGWLAGDARRGARWSTAAGSCPAGCRRAGCCRARCTRARRAAGERWWPRSRSWTA